jgi:hypothetical protein
MHSCPGVDKIQKPPHEGRVLDDLTAARIDVETEPGMDSLSL